MNTYLVRRRGIAGGANELDAALLRLRSFEDGPRPGVRRSHWLMSYALREADGTLGLACVLAAEDLQALRAHALAVRLPAGEVVRAISTRTARALDPANVYLVRRRHGNVDAAELDQVLASASRLADGDIAPDVRWQCSHALQEADGSLGSACLYWAADPKALIVHAIRAGLPAGDITPVLGRVVFHADPLERFAAPQTGDR